MTSMFNEKALNEAEEIYKTVQMNETQRKVINALSAKMVEYIPMSKLAMKGFALKAAKDWQTENKILAKELENLTIAQRVDFMKYALNHIKNNLVSILRDEENKTQIEDGVKATLQFYKQQFAQR